MKNSEIIDIIEKNLTNYINKGGIIKYPFPVADFAIRTFGLNVIYDEKLFSKYKNKAGMINIKKSIININPKREDFKIGDFVVPKELYIEESENQIIAHEIGHYVKYVNIDSRELFDKAYYVDEYSNIMFSNEVFANKYARNLLVPKDELNKFLGKNEIIGTIDILRESSIIRKYFGITEFMLEVRLKELKIPFVNGYYIPDQLKKDNLIYSRENLLKLLEISIGNGFGLSPDYSDSEKIAYLYNKAAGENIDSGPIYITLCRIAEGKYDHFEEICERRLRFINEQRKKIPDIQKQIILKKLEKEGAGKITIFGSFVKKGKAAFNDKSDIDILVDFKETKSIFEIMRIKNELEQMLSRKVDLVTENNIKDYIAESIEDNKEVLLQ
ncbi:nucleotidyltransferase domain-containing protein [uncultured Brachyspira sp.]|uniref:nucleotidyltransferase domain-containing protein n=1 Tax=uncultured Brachyspira sp. TaxID=221953 RepID=UPI0026262D53|nr:nucleotidyltransferase domain-containing protein [uncultured Brachyspira sp.]